MIEHEKLSGGLFTITINEPSKLNSLTLSDFTRIAKLIQQADADDEIIAVFLQSTGRFFSSGAQFDYFGEFEGMEPEKKEQRLRSEIATMNVYVADVFAQHSKPLVCCLNGPAIGLAASLVLLCDIVYAMNDQVYLLFPFSSLGFAAELGCSVTAPLKLGINRTNEHFVFSTKIQYKDMLQARLIAKDFHLRPGKTAEFNSQVHTLVQESLEGKNRHAMLNIQQLLSQKDALVRAQGRETSVTLPFWLHGEPLKRFKQLQTRQRKHRL
ncbi:hypothetical protein HG536_0H04060 [Torulaspora globosa]|uniref:3-hydroxyisobutyryl-CoA hydrolase, mitochondrial n=1 Tax=Torulaspora globosa TaxID=48254 RepID=A0A7G3ZNE4_9SACH|nr:uncharacterized protein HG536_0H04060 [Torulaspora globosa]QLL35030.1 hypothetical protein HG536_0H04060 [Torulaspora globosa]